LPEPSAVVVLLADPLSVTSEFEPALAGVIAPEIVNVGIVAAVKLTPVIFDPVTETVWFVGVNTTPTLLGVTVYVPFRRPGNV
jgi:hypothetical protein